MRMAPHPPRVGWGAFVFPAVRASEHGDDQDDDDDHQGAEDEVAAHGPLVKIWHQ